MSDAQEVKIDAMKLDKPRNDEHMGFHVEHDALIVEFDPRRLGIAAEYALYRAALTSEDDALKKIVKSDFTRRIWDADRARDKVFGGLALANKANLKHYVQAIADAAIRVGIPLDTFGNVSRKPLNEQTNAIHNILQDLRGEYAADVQTTGIQGWVDELERTNNVVIALVKERADETVAKATIAMKDARAAVDAAYRKIVERVSALVIVEGPENYAEYIAKLNEIIHRYMQSIKVREGRNAKKKAGVSEKAEGRAAKKKAGVSEAAEEKQPAKAKAGVSEEPAEKKPAGTKKK